MTVVKTPKVRACGPRASVAMLGLALSVGASGAILTSPGEANAADSTALTNLPSKASRQPLASVGSSHLSASAVAYHTVVEGEALWDIATYYNVDVLAIKQANGLAEDAVIKSGQVLKIPTNHSETAALPSTPSVAHPEESLAEDDGIKAMTFKEDSVASVVVPAPLPQERVVDVDAAVFDSPNTLSANGLDHLISGSTTADNASARSDIDRTDLSVSENTLVAIERSPLQPTIATPQSSEAHYEVQLGDTLWSISRDHQISPDALAEANNIRDPGRIFVGRNLVIPTGTVDRAADPAESFDSAHVDLVASQEITLGLPEDSSNVRAADLGVTSEAVVPSSDPVDPYVANLLTEVREAQSLNESSEAASSAQDSSLEIASGSTTIDYGDDLEASIPINPQFSGPSRSGANSIDEPVGNHLLAAAPLGSEVYAPISEDQTGRVVSPGMPILPESSQYLPETPSHFSGYVWPAHGVLTSGYGWRWGRMHQGIDVAGPVGTPIFSAAPGVVERSGWNSGGYGNLVEVRHPDGSMTRYAHNSRLLVESGQQVRQGQQIAEMGSTGYSTGPHLHFEIHLPNQGTVNPISYLPGR